MQNEEPSTSVTMPSELPTVALALVVHGCGIPKTVAAARTALASERCASR
jgi:hypothetical protein